MRQRNSLKAIVLLSCLFSKVGLFADEQYPLSRLQVEDGLSQNMVYCICQDCNRFMWFGTQDGLNKYDGNSFHVFKSGGNGQLGNDGIMCMAESPGGVMYIGTIHGLYEYDPIYENFTDLGVDGKIRDIKFFDSGDAVAIVDDWKIVGLPGNRVLYESTAEDSSVRSLCIDKEGNVWAAGNGSGLICIKKDGHIDSYGFNTTNLFTKVIASDSEHLLVGTMDSGVLSFNIRNHMFSALPDLDAGSVDFVHDIIMDSRNRVWIGAENGLFIMEGDKITHLTNIPNDPYSLSDNAVFSITEDREGVVWIGTYFGGVNYYSEFLSQFRKYYPIPGSNELKGKNTSELLEFSDGTIWIGTEDAGLHQFNPSTGEFKHGFLPATNVHALAEIGGNLWVGTYGDGLYIMNPKTKAAKNILFSKLGHTQLDDNVYSIYNDISGKIYIGTDSGLFEFKNNDIIPVDDSNIAGAVSDIYQDFYGNLWVATSGNGLYVRDADTGTWKTEDTPSKYISCILEDSRHDMWFGTEYSGMLHLSHTTDRFDVPYTVDDGLPDEMVYMLLEDASGNIWGSTNHGLFRASPESRRVVSFDHKSGLTGDQFNFRSGLKTRDGGFYFGGVKGFVGFYPDNIVWPESNSRIVFSTFLLRGRNVDYNSKNSPLTKSMVYTDKIAIKQKEAIFSIGFADLNFPLSGICHYQYRLLGSDPNWYEVGKGHVLSFSDLHHGRYVLEVRAIGPAGGVQGEPASIDIHILPPWYLTWWAFVIFASMAFAAAFALVYFIVSSSRKRNREILEKIETEKEKELYDSKIGFFTNITHEIRTPLTLITAPLEEIMEKTGEDSPAYEDLVIVKKNSERLLSLVNELLDFRKVEAGHILPNFMKIDLSSLVRETLTRFQPKFDKGKLSVEIDIPERLDAEVDSEIFTKILSNVLNNACKHASSIILVELSIKDDSFRLSITNDGDKIPEKDAQRIFDPFVKLDNNVPGSGLGLSFARTLASTHGGDIYLDTEKENTCFVVELPLTQQNVVISESHAEEDEPRRENAESNDGRAKILVVDDNEDFRSFLSRKLGEQYMVFTADNGNSAMEILSKEYVDLIVTDLMMPGMDGAAFCTSVKEDIKTSHIPVILVTAKSDMNTRITCIKQGADDFIPKPFQVGYLLLRIENLLKSRENLIKSFQSSPEFAVSSIATSHKDEEFLDKLKKTIESHIDNPDLDVDTLAESMHMSRATFYRKMKGFTEVSPNEFVRLYRLRKAAELLVSGNASINEVAFAVGFSSASYFTSCFSRQFGITPKEYISRNSHNDLRTN